MKQSPFETRWATIDDAVSIAHVSIAGWRAAYRGVMPDELLDNLSVEVRTERWAEHIRTGTSVFVATQEAKVVGFCAVGATRDKDCPPHTAEIRAIYVLPELWCRGAGRKLVQRATEFCRDAQFVRVMLWVGEANGAAQRFYESVGFTPDGHKKTEMFGGKELAELRFMRDVR